MNLVFPAVASGMPAMAHEMLFARPAAEGTRGQMTAEAAKSDRALSCRDLLSVFFFQAEDGIRDLIVTGVQTCALPIYGGAPAPNGGANRGELLRPFAGETSLFITPGYRFRAVDLLMTNFHLPRSTLFMLVAAFAGRETMLAAYRHAIGSGYRFYSYGDACLLHPDPTQWT